MRIPQVLPIDSATDTEKERFWSFVERKEDGHFVWTHEVPSGQWFFTFRGRNITPNRFAWGLAHPGQSLPYRIWRKSSCPYERCVNPDCWDVRPEIHNAPPLRDTEPKAMQPVSAAPLVPVDPKPAALGDHGLSVPPILEAYAALQFGIPVKPRPIHFTGRATEEVPAFPESEQTTALEERTTTFKALIDDGNARTAKCVHCQHTIKDHGAGLRCPATAPTVEISAPVGTAVVNPTVQDMVATAASEWNDPAKMLELIFTPGTCVMTFEDHVWFWNKQVRVDAPDGPRALVAALTLSGKRRTQG